MKLLRENGKVFCMFFQKNIFGSDFYRSFFFFFFFGDRFIPRYFVRHYDDGYAALTPEGLAAVEEELKEDTAYCIEGVDPKATLAA